MKHVVIVEDDPINAALLRKVLERRCGYRVTVTESPGEVLECVRAGADAILMDVSLQDSVFEGRHLTGIEICRMLKADPRTAGVPVILATAHAMHGDKQRLLAESGADGYVSKPITDFAAFERMMRERLGDAAA